MRHRFSPLDTTCTHKIEEGGKKRKLGCESGKERGRRRIGKDERGEEGGGGRGGGDRSIHAINRSQNTGTIREAEGLVWKAVFAWFNGGFP